VTALLVLLGSLVALAGVAGLIVWRVGESQASRPGTPVTSPRQLSPEELFERLLGASATAHTLVRAAVDGTCGTATPESGARARLVAQIGQADALHHQVLRDLQAEGAVLSRMPAGTALSADLVRATEASIQVDGAYRAWLEDLQATGCYSAPTNDAHFRVAAQATVGAGRAIEQLVAGWTGLASRLHLRPWTAADL
jgi:hypothetical protein